MTDARARALRAGSLLRELEVVLGAHPDGAWWASWCGNLRRELAAREPEAAIEHLVAHRCSIFGTAGSLRDLYLPGIVPRGKNGSPAQDAVDNMLTRLWEEFFAESS